MWLICFHYQYITVPQKKKNIEGVREGNIENNCKLNKQENIKLKRNRNKISERKLKPNYLSLKKVKVDLTGHYELTIF